MQASRHLRGEKQVALYCPPLFTRAYQLLVICANRIQLKLLLRLKCKKKGVEEKFLKLNFMIHLMLTTEFSASAAYSALAAKPHIREIPEIQ